MAANNFRRWGLIALVTIGVLAGAAALALHFGAKALKSQVEAALGPAAEIGEISLRWNGVEVRDLQLKAPSGWPATETLRAKRIIVEPDLLALLSGTVHVSRIMIEEGYVSALRTSDGKLRVVPSLLEKKQDNQSAATPALAIGRIELLNGEMAFFDATVGKRKQPYVLRLDRLNAHVTDIALPALDKKSQLRLEGNVKGGKGSKADGTMLVEGWMRFSNRDADIASRLRGVDLVALQPYLIKAAETGVKRGTLDSDVHATIKDKRLHAPGSITLNQLELDTSGSTFMGMPRQAAVGMMKDRKGKISVKFLLEGNIDDPKFSLNESLATRFGASFAETLGVSIEGVARGAGSIGQKGLEAVGGAAEGVGKALKGVFGK